MAKIGLSNFKYSVLTEAADGTPSYAGATSCGKAVSCSVSITNNDVKLYADDVLAESDTSFQSGTVSLGVDDLDVATMGALLGHTVVTTEGTNGTTVMTREADDVAPYVGLGRVITKMVGGSYQYKVEFLYKVKFSEPSQENTTKGESVEFGTTTLEGTIATLKNGKWSETATFGTLEAAQTYLTGLLAAPTP